MRQAAAAFGGRAAEYLLAAAAVMENAPDSEPAREAAAAEAGRLLERALDASEDFAVPPAQPSPVPSPPATPEAAPTSRGGLVHCMLPDSGKFAPPHTAKYVDVALEQMIGEMRRRGWA